MAVVVTKKITCDLTGRTLDEDKKAPATQTLEVGGENKIIVTITIPEDKDVDKDALLRAIGNAAEKLTRAPKATTLPADPPGDLSSAGDAAPAAPRNGRGKAASSTTDTAESARSEAAQDAVA